MVLQKKISVSTLVEETPILLECIANCLRLIASELDFFSLMSAFWIDNSHRDEL